MAKKAKVSKVSLETGVAESDLARLPLEALDKLDQLVVDTNHEVVDPILFPEDLVPAPAKDKILVGYHPITGVEIWQ